MDSAFYIRMSCDPLAFHEKDMLIRNKHKMIPQKKRFLDLCLATVPTMHPFLLELLK